MQSTSCVIDKCQHTMIIWKQTDLEVVISLPQLGLNMCSPPVCKIPNGLIEEHTGDSGVLPCLTVGRGWSSGRFGDLKLGEFFQLFGCGDVVENWGV